MRLAKISIHSKNEVAIYSFTSVKRRPHENTNCVSTCPHYPNEQVQNIWEGSAGSNKLPIGEHKVRSQGLSALLKSNLRRNSTLRNNNSQPLCYWSYWLFWWPWRQYRVMRRTLPNVACSGLPLMPLDAAARQVFATYRPGGCHGHWCCVWTNSLQNTNFSLPLT